MTRMKKAPVMRTQAEIQEAHDLLSEVAYNLPVASQIMRPNQYVEMSFALDALCWVLNHEGAAFAVNLERIRKRLNDLGLEMVDAEEPEGKVN